VTIWFVIPEDRLTDFRAAYLGQNVRDDEIIDSMVKGTNAAEESVLMTGSSRITSTQADNLGANHASWLQVFAEFPPVDVWKPIEDDEDT
jgi:hypothetical protein